MSRLGLCTPAGVMHLQEQQQQQQQQQAGLVSVLLAIVN
jgi:hypothetical protein